MKRSTRILFSVLLMAFLTLSLALPVQAFTERVGDSIIIAADEVIEDDLYAAAETVIVDGVIKGDLIVGAQSVIINGTIEGDLLAGAREIIINGTVQDDARVFGAAFVLGSEAVVGDDLIGAGASLETKPGSKIGGDLLMANGQNLLGGDVVGDVKLGTGAVELNGTIGGDAVFALGQVDNEGQPMGPIIFDPEQQVTIPHVAVGLRFGPDAKVGGKMEYIADRDLGVPGTVAQGGITRSEPVYDEEELREIHRANRTPGQRAVDAGINAIRDIASLVLIGLFMTWLFPAFLPALAGNIRNKTLPSLGWGVVAAAAFPFSLLVILFVMTVGAIIFGVLTLGGLSGALVVSSLTFMAVLSVGFVLIVAFVTKIAVSLLGGKLILERVNPTLGEHKFWPLALGILVYAILGMIPVVNVLLEMAIFLFGLGAIWLLTAEWWKNRQAQTA